MGLQELRFTYVAILASVVKTYSWSQSWVNSYEDVQFPDISRRGKTNFSSHINVKLRCVELGRNFKVWTCVGPCRFQLR